MVRSKRVPASVAMLGCLYGIAACSDNVAGPRVQGCEAALETAEEVRSFARGDVAAFQVASKPRELSALTFQNGEGEAASLADWSGRTVLLNLWATWCAPCRAEMPALDALQKENGDAAFEVVAVSIDRGEPDKPRAFLDEIGVTALKFFSDPTTKLFDELKSQGLTIGLPVTVIVDGEGCLVGHLAGPAHWSSEDAMALVSAIKDR